MTEPRRIALVRHACSSHVETRWVDADGFRRWREAYEAAGIRNDERPPSELRQLTDDAGIVLSSDAPRAGASARLLAGDREVAVSPLLRELDLEAAVPGRLRMPLSAWALLVGWRTLTLTLRGRYPSPAEAARVGAATAWLQDVASQHELVVVVTHAMFRRHVFARLLEDGWQAERGRRSMEHWSAWLLRRQ
jgi:hypothetical protein